MVPWHDVGVDVNVNVNVVKRTDGKEAVVRMSAEADSTLGDLFRTLQEDEVRLTVPCKLTVPCQPPSPPLLVLLVLLLLLLLLLVVVVLV